MATDYLTLPLGKITGYSDQYDPALLMAVPRVQTRDFMDDPHALPFHGTDEWNAFELSWLNCDGKPEIRCAKLLYNAHSPSIIESKSLKLYLNSLNQSVFDNATSVASTIQNDIAHCIGAEVECKLLELDEPSLLITPWDDLCIDFLDIEINDYHPHADLLKADFENNTEATIVSHLLRSLCPVTGQPDWASVRIHYRGATISHDSLLRYICAFRLHQGFHEQCIERMFCDLWQQCQPETLSIEGRFTRRGGLDINPFRCSHPSMQATQLRQARQ